MESEPQSGVCSCVGTNSDIIVTAGAADLREPWHWKANFPFKVPFSAKINSSIISHKPLMPVIGPERSSLALLASPFRKHLLKLTVLEFSLL